jgi:hypothetical protein
VGGIPDGNGKRTFFGTHDLHEFHDFMARPAAEIVRCANVAVRFESAGSGKNRLCDSRSGLLGWGIRAWPQAGARSLDHHGPGCNRSTVTKKGMS